MDTKTFGSRTTSELRGHILALPQGTLDDMVDIYRYKQSLFKGLSPRELRNTEAKLKRLLQKAKVKKEEMRGAEKILSEFIV